jgi:hypothetical protein
VGPGQDVTFKGSDLLPPTSPHGLPLLLLIQMYQSLDEVGAS